MTPRPQTDALRGSLDLVILIPLVLVVLAAVVLASDRLRDRLPGFLIDLVLGTVGWLAAIVYLRLFNERHLRLGSMSRLQGEDSEELKEWL